MLFVLLWFCDLTRPQPSPWFRLFGTDRDYRKQKAVQGGGKEMWETSGRHCVWRVCMLVTFEVCQCLGASGANIFWYGWKLLVSRHGYRLKHILLRVMVCRQSLWRVRVWHTPCFDNVICAWGHLFFCWWSWVWVNVTQFGLQVFWTVVYFKRG